MPPLEKLRVHFCCLHAARGLSNKPQLLVPAHDRCCKKIPASSKTSTLWGNAGNIRWHWQEPGHGYLQPCGNQILRGNPLKSHPEVQMLVETPAYPGSFCQPMC